MHKIIFEGYYGAENTGDDLFGLVSTWGSLKYWKKNNTLLMCNKGPISNTIEINYALSKKRYFKGYHLLESYLEILKTNYVILSGGSILHSKHKLISTRSFIFALAKLKIIKVAAIGVSIGPFNSEKDYLYIQEILKEFQFLVLRDKESYKIALEMNLPYNPILGADLAFLIPKMTSNNKQINNSNHSQKIIGVSLCHYERYSSKNFEKEKKRENKIFEVLNKLKNDLTIKFNFFIINGNNISGDKEITHSFINNLKLNSNQYIVSEYTEDTIKTIEKISTCNVMFSTRLHGAIFAASLNIPSILVEYHKKCTDYLDDIGILEEWRIGDMKGDPSLIVKKLYNLINYQYNDYYPNRTELIKNAEKNFISPKILDKLDVNEKGTR